MRLYELTNIDRWFLENIARSSTETECLKAQTFLTCKAIWFLRSTIGSGTKIDSESAIAIKRKTEGDAHRRTGSSIPARRNLKPTRLITTRPTATKMKRATSGKRKIMILGGGPNRIGQGIEFDYCCVHAAFALSELGFETIMVNSNPETVSTDYDTSDKLYFEPLTLEDVLNIYEQEKPEGVIVQFGGQTPLNLANRLEGERTFQSSARSQKALRLAEDRKHYSPRCWTSLGCVNRRMARPRTNKEAVAIAKTIGYPVLVRPSFRSRRARDGTRLSARRPASATWRTPLK